MRSRKWLVFACVSLAALQLTCGEGDGGGPTPVQSPVPQSTPLGTFAIVSSSPASGATLTGRDSDLQGVTGLTVTFQMSYTQSIADMYFVLALFDGGTECLRSQIGYSRRLDSSPAFVYEAGTTATYRSEFFVRDNQQGGCGASFTTNRIRFALQDRKQVDPATGQLRTLFWQEVTGGWSFVFVR